MVQEVTTTSWGKRIINALWATLFGIALIGAAIFLVFWNEGNGLHTAQSLEQAEHVLISVANTPIEAKNDGHVVYITGLAMTNDVLTDSLFKVSGKAIQLNRQVEMYQWKENEETTTEKEMGGSEKEVKTYTYQQVWSPEAINSADFKEKTGHQNPSMPIKSKIQYASHVTVGDFSLPSSLIMQMNGDTTIDLSKVNMAALKSKFNKPVTLQGDKLYIGKEAEMPEVGDLRVGMTEVLPATVSVIAQQGGKVLQPYMAPAGEAVSLLEMGQVSPQQMIHNAEVQNQMMTWLLRLASLVMMMIGFALMMSPVTVLADVVPFFGNLVGFGTALVAFTVGLFLWVVCFAIAWFTVRPFLAIGMVVLVAVMGYKVIFYKRH